MDTQVGIVAARPGCCWPTCCTCRASVRSCSRRCSRDYVEARVRAGVLEETTVDLLDSNTYC